MTNNVKKTLQLIETFLVMAAALGIVFVFSNFQEARPFLWIFILITIALALSGIINIVVAVLEKKWFDIGKSIYMTFLMIGFFLLVNINIEKTNISSESKQIFAQLNDMEQSEEKQELIARFDELEQQEDVLQSKERFLMYLCFAVFVVIKVVIYFGNKKIITKQEKSLENTKEV